MKNKVKIEKEGGGQRTGNQVNREQFINAVRHPMEKTGDQVNIRGGRGRNMNNEYRTRNDES